MARTSLPVIVLDPVTGQLVANAQVTVLNRADSSSATIYQDETSGTTLTQPILSDASGRVSGWLNRGAYIIQIQVPSRPLRTEYFDSSPASNGAIDSNWYGAGSVGTTQIGNAQVTSAKIAPNAVGSSQLANGAVGATQIANGAVGNTQLAANAVNTTNLVDASVTQSKLAAGLSAGNRTLYGANINQFQVDNHWNGWYIYPYYYPAPFTYYYRGEIYLFTSNPSAAGPVAHDVILSNLSTKCRVSVWLGGSTAYANADLGLTVTIDGVPQTPMISNVINHGPYSWFGWPFFFGNFQHINATQSFTVSPGTHSWNVKTTWGSAYAANATFVSSGSTMVLIQEEPNI